jgi:hypothetical protein
MKVCHHVPKGLGGLGISNVSRLLRSRQQANARNHAVPQGVTQLALVEGRNQNLGSALAFAWQVIRKTLRQRYDPILYAKTSYDNMINRKSNSQNAKPQQFVAPIADNIEHAEELATI